MIEDSYKKILVILFYAFLFSSNVEEQNHIFQNYIPYQESRISIGMDIYKYKNNLEYSYTVATWITNNLLLGGSLKSFNYENDLKLRYNFSVGYAFNFDENKILNNLFFNIGYNRLRFEESINKEKDMSYLILFNLRFNKFWVSIINGIIDGENYIKQHSFNIIKPIGTNFLLSIGQKININENKQSLKTPYISIKYKI